MIKVRIVSDTTGKLVVGIKYSKKEQYKNYSPYFSTIEEAEKFAKKKVKEYCNNIIIKVIE